MIGIYKITNEVTGEFYIGQSANIDERKEQHFRLEGGKSGHKLYEAMWEYGTRNFKFEVLEECKEGDLAERETYYIETLEPEYNIQVKSNKKEVTDTPVVHIDEEVVMSAPLKTLAEIVKENKSKDAKYKKLLQGVIKVRVPADYIAIGVAINKKVNGEFIKGFKWEEADIMLHYKRGLIMDVISTSIVAGKISCLADVIKAIEEAIV